MIDMESLENLPPELQVLVFSDVASPSDLQALAQTNIYFRNVLRANRDAIWRAFLMRDFDADDRFTRSLSADERKSAYFWMLFLFNAFIPGRMNAEPRNVLIKTLRDIRFFPRFYLLTKAQPQATISALLNQIDELHMAHLKRRMAANFVHWIVDGLEVRYDQTFLNSLLFNQESTIAFWLREVPFAKLVALRQRPSLYLTFADSERLENQLNDYRNARDLPNDSIEQQAVVDWHVEQRELKYPEGFVDALVDALLSARKRRFSDDSLDSSVSD